MNYKLVIDDVIEFPVKFTANDAGKTVAFNFRLQARRIQSEEMRAILQDEDRVVKDFLHDKLVGWVGQRLVAGDDGQPADFSPEALDCMLSLFGMEGIIFSAYLRGVVLADGQAEKQKN
jgi:hypothetical protein